MPKAGVPTKEDQFTQRLTDIYSDKSKEIIACHSILHSKTFRINTLKSNMLEVLDSLKTKGFEITESSMQKAYICLNESESIRLSDTDASKSFKIYIQELSSMIPALLLDLQTGDKVLDLCAAPGSKTTQIADTLGNKGEIVANEQNRDRFFKLMQIIKDYGAVVKTINENGKILPHKYPNYVQYFDKIIVDVPCSNEASLRFDQPKTFKFWKSSNSSGLSKLQKGILAAGISMLKPGGTLIYSTCTYAVEENEGVVDWALKKHPDIKLEEIDFSKIPELENVKNTLPGLTEYKNKNFDKSLGNTLRILPNEYFKGFYVAKLIKRL